MNGYGTARYANGGIYTGGFVDGEREGEGTLVYASGEEVTGMWEDGQLMGGADPLSANRVSD
jgi:hypothetical protein